MIMMIFGMSRKSENSEVVGNRPSRFEKGRENSV